MLPESVKMPGVRLRQVRFKDGRVFTLRPSFVLSYMTGTVEDLEHPLLLLSFGVPCWVVTMIFGRNDIYWQRLMERLGRNSLVGTSVRDPTLTDSTNNNTTPIGYTTFKLARPWQVPDRTHRKR